MAGRPPDVFIHADGTVETRSRVVELPGGGYEFEFREPVPNTPRHRVPIGLAPSDLSPAGEPDYWVRTWQLLRTAPGDGHAATHGVRIFVERP